METIATLEKQEVTEVSLEQLKKKKDIEIITGLLERLNDRQIGVIRGIVRGMLYGYKPN